MRAGARARWTDLLCGWRCVRATEEDGAALCRATTCRHSSAFTSAGPRLLDADPLAQDRQRGHRGAGERCGFLRQALSTWCRREERYRIHPVPAEGWWLSLTVASAKSIVDVDKGRDAVVVPVVLDRYQGVVYACGPPSTVSEGAGRAIDPDVLVRG